MSEYRSMLEEGYRYLVGAYGKDRDLSRLGYLGSFIFDFTTYDSEMDEFFAKKAVEVCDAITMKKTHAYIKGDDNYQWYLVMVNMPFFHERLEWGTSIRGAWWTYGERFEFESCGLWKDGKQVHEPIVMTNEEWSEFILAIVEFARAETFSSEAPPR